MIYNSLPKEISARYKIDRGSNESEWQWISRIIYSLCGAMAYSSSWDESHDDNISITHVKHRIIAIINSYKNIFPELVTQFTIDTDSFCKEIIEDIYIKTGIFYHKKYNISASAYSSASISNIHFLRGIAIDEIDEISGIGFLTQNSIDDTNTIFDMFQLSSRKLNELWKSIVSTAIFKRTPMFSEKCEYLRMRPPFTSGYWVNQPYKSGITSILRIGEPGNYSYYLYRISEGEFETSPLPHWKTDNYQYRSISCSCLSHYNTLPNIEYGIDGDLVHFKFNYLPPPAELNWIKLYTWPEFFTSFPCDFKRQCSLKVFSAIKKVLSGQGFEFIMR